MAEKQKDVCSPCLGNASAPTGGLSFVIAQTGGQYMV